MVSIKLFWSETCIRAAAIKEMTSNVQLTLVHISCEGKIATDSLVDTTQKSRQEALASDDVFEATFTAFTATIDSTHPEAAQAILAAVITADLF